MQEQEKRGPGRPRKQETRRRIDITLSNGALDWLDSLYASRSETIEKCINEYRKLHPDQNK